MPRNSRRRSGGRGRRTYYWDGIQFPLTNVPATGQPFELIGATSQEFMPATLVRVRGFLTAGHVGSASNVQNTLLSLKLMYLELNDAGALTGDDTAIDTNEEDIAKRQLWTYHTAFPITVDTEEGKGLFITIEVDVKVKIRLDPSGKRTLVLLADASATNAIQIAGYLRALMLHG